MSPRKQKNLSDVLTQAKENQKIFPEPEKIKESQGRKEKKGVMTYLDRDAHTKLKILSAEMGTTVQDLSAEAFVLLFKKYAKD